eukprot:759446-Hanusia_phi.AAC.3
MEEKEDKQRKKDEEIRAKEEEKQRKREDIRAKEEEKQRKKEEELVKLKEKKEPKKMEKSDDKEKKVKQSVEKPKDSATVKQASFMASFFKKSGDSPTKSKDEDRSSASKADSVSPPNESAFKELSCKTASSFRPWEAPRNAVVASFPFGPAPNSKSTRTAPIDSDLQSWLDLLRKEPIRERPQRALREDGKVHPKMKLIQLNMKLPVVKTQLVDVDVDASQKVIWDIEEEGQEAKLEGIMNEAEPTSDGLYRYRGRILQFLTEGGGWFDCRRPPYYGTVSRASAAVNGRRPLHQDPELDYSYESDADWESEVGEGEDLGSDLDGEDEEEEYEEEDGGFVVPDGYMSDDGMENGVCKKKLQQILHYQSLPVELAEMLSVKILDNLPLCLSSDPNIHLDPDTDYYGDDIGHARAASLEAAIQILYNHPTAVAFTYLLPDSEHKLAGTVFLKGQKALEQKQEYPGMVSGCLKRISDAKKQAIWKELFASKSEAAAMATTANKPAQNSGGKAGGSAQMKIEDKHLLAIVKILHGSTRSKSDLVQAFIAACPELSKSKAERIISCVASKKVELGASRWVLLDDTIKRSPFIPEIAKEAWKNNTRKNAAPVS